ncbi:MAG: ATP-binding protein [Thermoplasmata archaeon]
MSPLIVHDMTGEGLTVNEKILLHLKDCRSSRENLSPGATQEGIARGVDIRRSHVPRAVKKLVSEGSIEEIKGRLPGKARKVKMYILTEPGMRIAREISEEIEKERVIIIGVEETEMTIRDARLAFEMTTLEILRNMSPEGVLEIPEEMEEEEIEFLDRKEELSEMRDWLNRDTALLVIYGPEGFGKTRLARRFLKMLKKFDICWKELSEDDSTYELFQTISEYLARRGSKRALELFEDGDIDDLLSSLPEEMASIRSVYVFDNYFHLGEDVVDFFSYLTKSSNKLKDSRVLILAREATPSYCRFYTKDSVERELVREIHLKGLDEENSKLLLGQPDIDEESFRRVYLLTKGCPLYLQLIRDGDAEELGRRSRFTNPEIKLLMFSKDVKAK